MRYSLVSAAVAGAAALLLSGCVTPSNADKTVELQVGQTRHLTAYRANACGARPPSFEAIKNRLPKSSLVTYSDGGLSSRVSNACRVRVPTRAVNATAIASGTEGHVFQSGSIAIVVK